MLDSSRSRKFATVIFGFTKKQIIHCCMTPFIFNEFEKHLEF